MSWTSLIRFVAEDGKTYRGEPIIAAGEDVGKIVASGTTLRAKVITGEDIFTDAVVTEEVKEVKTLLGPLTADQIPIFKCIGLNYMKHIQEGGRTPPPYPSVFYKPADAVGDHGVAVPVVPIAHPQLDYEGELCVVIGKDGKDISEADALSYVAGYTSGNDISNRQWQKDPKFAGGVPQWGFAKSFDQFAPLGPALVSPKVIPNPGVLALQTRVNGELRQDTNTNDLLFNVPKIIAFLSQGTTLRKGTVIMTGTPSGVAMGMKEPKWLNNGDVCEVYIEKIGTLSNAMKFL